MELMHAVVTQESAKISCNFEQIEAAIKEKLSQYEGIVFEEGSKTYAKKDVPKRRPSRITSARKSGNTWHPGRRLKPEPGLLSTCTISL